MLAIKRSGEGISTPGAKDTLHAGDVLVLAGSAESIKSARLLLHGSPPAPAPALAPALAEPVKQPEP